MDREPKHSARRQQNALSIERTTHKTALIVPDDIRGAFSGEHDDCHRLPLRDGLSRQPAAQLGVTHSQLDSPLQEVHLLTRELRRSQRKSHRSN